MKKLIVLIFLFTISLNATTIIPIKLSELVKKSDHIVIATVIKVDLIDGDGKEIKDEKKGTKPGSSNKIRLHIKIVKDGILKTTGNKNVEELIISKCTALHNLLGGIKGVYEGGSFIFLLKGENYEYAYPVYFIREMADKKEIEKLLNKK